MREILFRGKQKYTGKWIEGYYVMVDPMDMPAGIRKPKAVIFPVNAECNWFNKYFYNATEVVPETVGQFTGLFDKNGKKIFEGDIISTRKNGTITKKLKGYYGVDSDGYPQRIPGYEGTSEYHYPCQVDCYAEVKHNVRCGFYLAGTSMFVDAICNEVVGNIHDNPELLEVK